MPTRAPLASLLTAYVAADANESRHRERMLALLRASGNPFSRAHCTPGHFTASGFVLSPDARAILLIHHRKLDRWLQPGGHIEVQDIDMLAAARRELAEEVGLPALPLEIEGIFDLDVHSLPALGAEPPHEHFDVRFLFRAPSFELNPGSEAKAARWFPLDAIDAALADPSVARVSRKLLADDSRRRRSN
jgi:8-oxo-dGTP pyrophosphatase MutT (NUDIX family)